MDDIKKTILNDLKEINYPGYSRDIVSFGIIKDIIINDNKIIFLLKVSTELENSKDVIKDSIINLINNKYNFDSIDVQFSMSSEAINLGSTNKIKNIIAIASCKGGVGKSTVAINIASTLAKNYKVGLLDLDIYGPSLPTLIGENQQPEFKENKIIPVKKFNMELMSFGFINNENSPAIWRGPMVSRMTQQFFENVNWGKLDYLILDLPPGTGDIQLTLVQKIKLTGAVIVTTPQDLSHVDVKKGSDMFKKVDTPIIGVIENMVGASISGKLSDVDISKASLEINNNKINLDNKGNFNFIHNIFSGESGLKESQRLGLPLLGQIPLDYNLSESCDLGIPYVTNNLDSIIKLEFSKIAEAIF